MEDRNSKQENFLIAVMMILIGLMFVILRGVVVKYTLTTLGLLVIIWGIVDLVHKRTTPGIVKVVLGAIVILLGWLIVIVMLYVAAVLMIAYGVYEMIWIAKQRPQITLQVVMYSLRPIMTFIAGVFLMFNQGGVIDWVFVVSGILLMVEGVLRLLPCMPE